MEAPVGVTAVVVTLGAFAGLGSTWAAYSASMNSYLSAMLVGARIGHPPGASSSPALGPTSALSGRPQVKMVHTDPGDSQRHRDGDRPSPRNAGEY
jgi:hypothetical protein